AYSLDISKNKKINFAIETEYKKETLNQSNLVFSGMIDTWGNINFNNSSTIIDYSNQKLYFNSGILFQINDYFIGLSVKNIYSIYFNQQNKTPIEINFSFKKNKIINKNNIRLNAYSQIYSNVAQQINLLNGIELEYSSFQTGIFSVQNIYSDKLTNGIMTFVGLTYRKINIVYSYEFFYSSLFLNKSSLHEFSLNYRIKCSEKNRKNTINCPAYQL
ncbi:MAG: type IX secretion system membrane protein PorP/SprF, partial [Bacteroidota bacterium]|nr:type IX secretion system membrane protein PorP/SprF [Bacteroidota bacterium]